MNMSHFVYPFICYGHVGCFQLLATVNSAAMSICVQAFSEYLFSILLSIHLRRELLVYMIFNV